MSDQDERYHAGSKADVHERGRKEKRATAQFDDDLRELMATAAGQRVLGHILYQLCRTQESSYDSSGQRFAYLEGRRSIGVELEAELQHADPDAWLAMVRARVKPRV